MLLMRSCFGVLFILFSIREIKGWPRTFLKQRRNSRRKEIRTDGDQRKLWRGADVQEQERDDCADDDDDFDDGGLRKPMRADLIFLLNCKLAVTHHKSRSPYPAGFFTGRLIHLFPKSLLNGLNRYKLSGDFAFHCCTLRNPPPWCATVPQNAECRL
jgi:hypothetical protein